MKLDLDVVKIEVVKIVVMLTDGADEVSIFTKLPSPYPIDITDQDLVMSFKTQRNSGIKYVNQNFNITPRVVDVRTRSEIRFSQGK